jgi:hypothetical protein
MHDDIIVDTKSRLERICEEVYVCEEYVLNDGRCGEVDIYAKCVRPSGQIDYLVFEMKRTNNPQNKNKAHYQLRRDYSFIDENFSYDRIIEFFAFSAKNRRGYDIKRYYNGNR